jgi:hypothetical protein
MTCSDFLIVSSRVTLMPLEHRSRMPDARELYTAIQEHP